MLVPDLPRSDLTTTDYNETSDPHSTSQSPITLPTTPVVTAGVLHYIFSGFNLPPVPEAPLLVPNTEVLMDIPLEGEIHLDSQLLHISQERLRHPHT